MIAMLVLQTLIGLGPHTAAWDVYPDPTATMRLYVDDVPVGDVPAAVTSQDFSAKTFGAHQLAISALVGNVESAKLKIPFTTVAPQNDPGCIAPFGIHAPAVFPTSLQTTTGKTGSPAFQNFLVTAPDPVVEIALVIDGKDQLPIGAGTDLRAFTGLKFAMPLPGTHTMGVRVLTAFGCNLLKQAAPLVVKP